MSKAKEAIIATMIALNSVGVLTAISLPFLPNIKNIVNSKDVISLPYSIEEAQNTKLSIGSTWEGLPPNYVRFKGRPFDLFPLVVIKKPIYEDDEKQDENATLLQYTGVDGNAHVIALKAPSKTPIG